MKITHGIYLMAVILLMLSNSFAQTEREKGIDQYRKGNFQEAVSLLNKARKQKTYKTDAETWNYLGLAYIGQDMLKDGRKAFEKAVELAPQNAVIRTNLAYALLLNRDVDKAQREIQKAIGIDPRNANAHYIRGTAHLWEGQNETAVADAVRVIALDPKFTPAYVLHTDGLLAEFGTHWSAESNPNEYINLLERAGETLRKCLSDCPQNGDLKPVKERLEAVNAFIVFFKKAKTSSGSLAPNAAATADKIPLNITFKPRPSYTSQGRAAGEQGDVRIAVMFGSDGRSKYLMVLKGLRYGLTEQALAAARGITFEPEKIDGKPVSVVKIVVFTYQIY